MTYSLSILTARKSRISKTAPNMLQVNMYISVRIDPDGPRSLEKMPYEALNTAKMLPTIPIMAMMRVAFFNEQQH